MLSLHQLQQQEVDDWLLPQIKANHKQIVYALEYFDALQYGEMKRGNAWHRMSAEELIAYPLPRVIACFLALGNNDWQLPPLEYIEQLAATIQRGFNQLKTRIPEAAAEGVRGRSHHDRIPSIVRQRNTDDILAMIGDIPI